MYAIKKIHILCHYTIREFLSHKLFLIVCILCAFFFFFISLLDYFQPQEQVKIVIDLGLTVFSFFSFLSVLFGVPLIIHRKSGQDVLFLTKPIRRGELLAGKVLGILVCLISGMISMAFVIMVTLIIRFGECPKEIVGVGVLLIAKYGVFLSVIVLLSCLLDRLMVYCVGAIIFFVSNGLMFFETIAQQTNHSFYDIFLGVMKCVLPRFDLFNMYDVLLLGKTIPILYCIKVLGYGLAYFIVMHICALYVYAHKDF